MIGNDIIDLKVAALDSNIERRGFQQKLFCESERKFLAGTNDLFTTTWLLWAMKEAAYKAHQRRRALPRHYDPKFYNCTLIEKNEQFASGKVRAGEDIYEIRANVTKEYIHCIATNLPQNKKYSLIKSSFIDIHSSILDKVSNLLGVNRDEMAIIKDRNFIPHLCYKNHILPLAFSLSHHGKFSAFSLSLMNY